MVTIVAMVETVRPIVAVTIAITRAIDAVAGVIPRVGIVGAVAVSIVSRRVAVSISGISITIIAVRVTRDGAANDGAGSKGAKSPTPSWLRCWLASDPRQHAVLRH